MDLVKLFEGESLIVKVIFVLVFLLTSKNIITIPFTVKKRKSHKGCSLHTHMLKSISDQARIIRIKHIDTLYEQMSMLESIHDEITLRMRAIYNHIAHETQDKEHYSLLVNVLEKEVKGLFRKWFKENHFTSRTELEFKTYVDEKVSQLLQRVSFGIDEKYKGFDFPRDELRKEHEKDFIAFAGNKFRDAFYKARDISAEKEKQVDEIIKHLEDIE